MHYYQFNIGDYARETGHLSEIEDLAYRRMLDLYYTRESALPSEVSEIARLIRMRTHCESINIVLQDFFVSYADGYHCKRADKEIAAFKSKSDKASKSAKSRWNKNNHLVDANALQTQSDGNAKHKTLNTKHETDIKDIEQSALLETGFNIFYSAGLVKKSKVQAFKKFKALVKQMNADPVEFGNLVAIDVKNRIAKQQFGIDKLHPSTYLNNQRWDDEHETNNGNGAPSGRQSAAERIAARNAAKYGQSSSGLGLATGGGDLRGTVDEGEWRDSFPHVDPCPEQIEYVDCEEWDSSDHH